MGHVMVFEQPFLGTFWAKLCQCLFWRNSAFHERNWDSEVSRTPHAFMLCVSFLRLSLAFCKSVFAAAPFPLQKEVFFGVLLCHQAPCYSKGEVLPFILPCLAERSVRLMRQCACFLLFSFLLLLFSICCLCSWVHIDILSAATKIRPWQEWQQGFCAEEQSSSGTGRISEPLESSN